MTSSQNSSEKTGRLDWIDALKGLGILSVVIGHMVNGLIEDCFFLFHMPLFFFIGGFLYKKRTSLKEYFQAKFVHLMVPYCAFLIVLYSKDVFELLVYHQPTLTVTAETLLRPVVGGRALREWTTVFWFVTCFFAVQQLFNWMANQFDTRRLSILCFCMLLLSYVNSQFFPDLWLPLNLNVVAAALPFFLAGHLFKQIYQEKMVYWWATAVSTVCLLLVRQLPIAYDMKYADYGIPFFSLISALSLILLMVFLAQKVVSLPIFKQSLTHIGSASMVIMYLHQPILFSMRHFGIHNLMFQFTAATILPFITYLLLRRHYWTSAIFLGNYTDYMRLINRKHCQSGNS